LLIDHAAVVAAEDEQLQPNVVAFSAALKAGQSFSLLPVQKLVQLKWIQLVWLKRQLRVTHMHESK
jgi:hypothetical protein